MKFRKEQIERLRQRKYPYQDSEGKWGFTDVFGKVVEPAHFDKLEENENLYKDIEGCREKDPIKPLSLREILKKYYDFNIADFEINSLEELWKELENYDCNIEYWQDECEKVYALDGDIDIYRFDFGKNAINCVGIVRYGLMKNGKEITDFDWDNIYPEHEGLCRISSNQSLSISLETFSTSLPHLDFETLLDLTKREDIDNDVEDCEYGFINLKGDMVIPLKYDDASDFYEGVAAVRYADEWGYIDKNDSVVIPFKFDWAGDFQDGFARVLFAGLYYVIDKEGNCYESFEDIENGNGSRFYFISVH